MAVERSPLQRVSDSVFERIQSLRDEPITPETPFGFERVDKNTAKMRLAEMSPEGRKALINKVGLDNVRKIIGS